MKHYIIIGALFVLLNQLLGVLVGVKWTYNVMSPLIIDHHRQYVFWQEQYRNLWVWTDRAIALEARQAPLMLEVSDRLDKANKALKQKTGYEIGQGLIVRSVTVNNYSHTEKDGYNEWIIKDIRVQNNETFLQLESELDSHREWWPANQLNPK